MQPAATNCCAIKQAGLKSLMSIGQHRLAAPKFNEHANPSAKGCVASNAITKMAAIWASRLIPYVKCIDFCCGGV